MHPKLIRAELQMKGWTGERLGRELGVTPSAVYRVIHRRAKSRRIAVCIAAKLDRPIGALWPGQYEYRGPGRRRAA